MSYQMFDAPPKAGIGFLKINQRCIGKKSNGAECQEIAPNDPPHPEHPSWPYLCPFCANEPPNKGSRNSNGIVQEKPKLS
jgi:hypothetical protein